MLTLQLLDPAGEIVGEVRSPVLPRVGEYLTLNGRRYLVAEVDLLFAGGQLDAVRLVVR